MIVYTKFELPAKQFDKLEYNRSTKRQAIISRRPFYSAMIVNMETSFCYFHVLRVFCFVTGVLPIKKLTRLDVESKIEVSNSYKISYIGSSLWITLFAVNYYILTNHYRKFVIYANAQLQTCFQTNFCLQLVEKAIINIHPVIPLISIFYCFPLKLRCIEQAERLYIQLYDRSGKRPLYCFLFVQIIGILSYVAKLRDIPIWKIFIHCYRYIGVISLDCIIMTLCHTIGKTFEDINRSIDHMIDTGNIDLNLLFELEKKHWRTGNLTNDMSKSFCINGLFIWPYNIVHTITFLMFLTDVRNHPIEVNVHILNEACKFVVFLSVIVYCGWIGTLLSKEAERTKVCLEKLKLKYQNHLDDSTLKLIRIFCMKLNSRKIRLTAAGFLLVDMKMIQSFLGLILTYWIVLVQFRNN